MTISVIPSCDTSIPPVQLMDFYLRRFHGEAFEYQLWFLLIADQSLHRLGSRASGFIFPFCFLHAVFTFNVWRIERPRSSFPENKKRTSVPQTAFRPFQTSRSSRSFVVYRTWSERTVLDLRFHVQLRKIGPRFQYCNV